MGQELTKSDVKRIQDEIDHRKLVLRPQITKEIAEAAAQGDRSENFEYYAAKKANRENNGRINYLERVLRFAKIIDDSSKEDEVGLNNTVTLYFEEDDEEEVYRIVTSIRGHSLLGLISNESPIGRAIMGHKVGDRCEVTTENGLSYFVVIRNIENTGESEDDHIKAF
ncbi:transcription elongation factor GreA [Oribacterium sp. KHPX15]|uniref:GreA/GreB family elongation factor n=1 Tax=Oribacterium sp. KHPX15 TaxID=1855342 RepID=UPI00089D31D0|nr:transcription elongation factor GreA [Oribacterium sp. KHPX15]SEA54048.1 transcription elongation factor GreA [Oribacterium sp. KHPX15]